MNSELARRVYEVSHITGEFTLRSGATTSEYFDKYQFESDPVLLQDITAEMMALIPASTQILAGLELGGIPLVTMLSQKTGLPACFVRKHAKGYGTMRRIEGPSVAGCRIVVVEDVVTSGGAIVEAVNELQRLDADVTLAVCVLDREAGAAQRLSAQGVALRALFQRADLEAAAGAKPA